MRRSDSYKSAKVVAELRRIATWYCPERKKAKDSAKRKDYLLKIDGTKSKKYKTAWECARCGVLTEKPHMHHINEVGDTLPYPFTPDEIVDYVKRVFVKAEDYLCLCKECHHKEHHEN